MGGLDEPGFIQLRFDAVLNAGAPQRLVELPQPLAKLGNARPFEDEVVFPDDVGEPGVLLQPLRHNEGRNPVRRKIKVDVGVHRFLLAARIRGPSI